MIFAFAKQYENQFDLKNISDKFVGFEEEKI